MTKHALWLMLLTSAIFTNAAFAHCGAVGSSTYFDTINPLVLPHPESDDFNGALVPGPNLGPNGILDSDEFALLAKVISNDANPLHDAACTAYTANLARATTDLPAGYRETVAAYFTLGDTDTVHAMVAFFAFFAITINPANYDLSQAAFFGPNGDADGDLVTNKQEYDAIVGAGGPGSAKRTQYLANALTPTAGEGEGEGEGEGQSCVVAAIPDLTPQGEAFYQVLAALALQPYAWETTDVDATGIADRFEAALVKHVVTHGGVLHDDAQCPYSQNLAAAAIEPNVGLIQLQTGVNVKDVLATLLSVSDELQSTLATIGLSGTYSVIDSHAKHGDTPLSPEGDPDDDGFSNLEEYNNVIADGGDEAEYVAAALNPLLDGTAASAENVPVVGIAAASVLFGAFGFAGAFVVRRKKR